MTDYQYALGFAAYALTHPEVGEPITDEYPDGPLTYQNTTEGKLIYDRNARIIGFLKAGADLTVTADILHVRKSPSTAAAILDDLPRGCPVHQLFAASVQADSHTWVYVQAPSRQTEGWVASEYLSSSEPSDDGELSMEPDHAFSFEELWPCIQAAGAEFGFDPRILAGMVMQESNFVNLRYHQDKTGHGLLGLDDNGLLPDFEVWSGSSVGRGVGAAIIPPMLQLRYAAKVLAGYTERFGPTGYRAWYTGPGRWQSADGDLYQQLIEAHIRELFG